MIYSLWQPTKAADPTGERVIARSLREFRNSASSLHKDERGSIAILFALTTLVVMSLVGGAVDYGRAVTAREQMQQAVDASVLAAARVWQTETNWSLAQSKANMSYDVNKPHNMTSAVATIVKDDVQSTINMRVSGHVKTPFLSLVLADGYEISAEAQAKLQIGGNAEQHLEVSLMLDVTGSMSGSKITDLKIAAKDLIDIVVWDDQSTYKSRVAIAPFADAVRVPSALINTIRGTNLSSGTSSTYGHKKLSFTNASNDGKTFEVSTACVTERTGANAYTDVAPAGSPVGRLYTSGATCSMSSDNEIVPLSNDREMLKGKITNLDLAGSTAGQLGTAWAWYLLSPNWANLWAADRQPVAYNTPKTQKIAVLMTDGEYNTGYCKGVLSKELYGSNDDQINCNATNGSSPSQALSMCDGMKNPANGITVYTVGFALGGNQTAIDTLRNCATDTSKFYNAADGAALKAAFRDIALRLASMRLSN